MYKIHLQTTTNKKQQSIEKTNSQYLNMLGIPVFLGVVEGRKIPPPMLTPLENAPLPPSFNLFEKKERKKKKKKREREKEKEKERESDIKSPPMDIEPPRGYAAPLHPPPSANIRSQRAQSGIPAPRYSKQQPQRHESR